LDELNERRICVEAIVDYDFILTVKHFTAARVIQSFGFVKQLVNAHGHVERVQCHAKSDYAASWKKNEFIL
jgi:formate-dependent phosphoribosylglycinamide formyltransferase (GAR transformylase)